MRLLTLTALACGLATMALAAEAGWPVASDIPDPRPAAAGLAGAEPPNIVRYLKVSGADRRAAISPDGAHVAYLARTTGEPQLWIVDTVGGSPSQLTFGAGVSNFRWTPAGELMVAADSDGDEREGYTILSTDGRRERRLLAPSDAFNMIGDFSEDGSQLAYSTTARNGVDFDIHVVDAASGESREVYQGTFGYFARAWRPGGDQVLVSEARGEDANNLYLLNISTGDLRTLFKPVDRARYQDFAWTPDGSGFYLATNHEREYQGLAYADLSMDVLQLEFLETPEMDVADVTLVGNGRYLVWTTNDGGYDRLHLRDLKRGRDLKTPELPDGIYTVSGAADAAMLSVRINGPTTPGDVWVIDARKSTATQVVAPRNAGLDLASFARPTPISFAARDGLTLHGLLYLPGENASLGAKPPVVLGLHGGPTAQARPGFEPVTEYLLSRGVAVFELNFRGSTGYGKRFAQLNDRRLRANEIFDVADAVGYLKTRDDVDASRVAPMGGSYGGYLVNAAMGAFPDLFSAGVSFVGVTDWVRALEGASPALKASDLIEYGDTSDPDDRAFFEEISPIKKAGEIRAPMLVVHGANDPRDPVTESDLLVETVRANDVPVTYLRFRDEGHSLRKLRNRVHAYREVVTFLETHLAPVSETDE